MSQMRPYSAKRHLYNVGLGLSQLFNALLAGDPDDSLSGRCGKGREAGSPGWTAAAWLLDLVWSPFERDHCANSIERDEGKAAAGRLGAFGLLAWVMIALAISFLVFR
jgi:hypothetical protein